MQQPTKEQFWIDLHEVNAATYEAVYALHRNRLRECVTEIPDLLHIAITDHSFSSRNLSYVMGILLAVGFDLARPDDNTLCSARALLPVYRAYGEQLIEPANNVAAILRGGPHIKRRLVVEESEWSVIHADIQRMPQIAIYGEIQEMRLCTCEDGPHGLRPTSKATAIPTRLITLACSDASFDTLCNRHTLPMSPALNAPLICPRDKTVKENK